MKPKTIKLKKCPKCFTEFSKPYKYSVAQWATKTFCSCKCSALNRKNVELTDEHKRKISMALRGKITWMKGKKHTPESIKKLKDSHVGIKYPPRSQEYREKRSLQYQEEKGPGWKGGITSKSMTIRKSLEYRDWRTAVFQRDNYTCQECGSRGVTLNADHIKPFAYYPELRLVIDNGRTLCVPCHRKTDTYGTKIKFNLKQVYANS